MRTVRFTSWQDGEFFLGFLNDYSDYTIQGMSKEELAVNLKDLLADLESGDIPYIQKHELELQRTAARYAAGRLEILDWQDAKTELRQRFR